MSVITLMGKARALDQPCTRRRRLPECRDFDGRLFLGAGLAAVDRAGGGPRQVRHQRVGGGGAVLPLQEPHPPPHQHGQSVPVAFTRSHLHTSHPGFPQTGLPIFAPFFICDNSTKGACLICIIYGVYPGRASSQNFLMWFRCFSN